MEKISEVKQSGLNLWEKLFGEDVELYELEDMDDVTDIEQETKGVNGWWIEIEHTFRYCGKLYSLMEKTHSSPNVCDNEYLWETFHEVEEDKAEKTVILFTRSVGELPFSQVHEPQSFYENMVKMKEDVAFTKDDEVAFLVKILEFEGTVPPAFIDFVTKSLLYNIPRNQEIYPVKAVL